MTHPIDLLLSRLEGVKRHGGAYSARCPAHFDKHPSLAIKEGDDGRVLVKCFAGCTFLEIVSAVGLTAADMFVRNERARTPQDRARARQSARLADMDAALGVAAREVIVAQIAASDLAAGKTLSAEDLARVTLASDRLSRVRQMVRGDL